MHKDSYHRRVLTVIAIFMSITVLLIVGFWVVGNLVKDDPMPTPAPTTTTSTTSVAPTTTSTTSEPPSLNDGPAPATVGTFHMDGLATITNATYDAMAYVLPLDPPGPQETMVRWVDGWGQSPATAEAGTVYVLGHAWGQAPLVFNPISEVVTAHVDLSHPTMVPGVEVPEVARYTTDVLNGSVITMRDEAGLAREWVVDNAYLIDKYEAIDDTELVNEQLPGRIVLIACSTDGSVDLEYNVIVTGHLR